MGAADLDRRIWSINHTVRMFARRVPIAYACVRCLLLLLLNVVRGQSLAR